jgi:hypothetical protein
MTISDYRRIGYFKMGFEKASPEKNLFIRGV